MPETDRAAPPAPPAASRAPSRMATLVLIAVLLAAGTPHFVPHERVAEHAQSRGVRKIVIAAPGDDAMIERLVAYFDGRD